MKSSSTATAIAIASLVTLGVAPAARAQQPPPVATEVGGALLAKVTLPAKAKLAVSSPAFKAGADIPMENTQYKGNIFPGLSWSAGPSGTKSYVIIMQDADILRNDMPIFHWSMVNIPASITKLDPAMSAPPTGAQYGPNIRGAAQAYMGPRTPAGPKHRYHLQVFALDATISGETPATYALLIDAMKGHVLASGETIGLGSAPSPGGAE